MSSKEDKYLYRLNGELHAGVETSDWKPTDIDRGNEYPWETKLNPYYSPTSKELIEEAKK